MVRGRGGSRSVRGWPSFARGAAQRIDRSPFLASELLTSRIDDLLQVLDRQLVGLREGPNRFYAGRLRSRFACNMCLALRRIFLRN